MVTFLFHPIALILSYLLELAALPLHAYRLMRLRLAAQRRVYELKLGSEQELSALRTTIKLAAKMEQEVAEADLGLLSSRLLALQALQLSIARLRQRVVASFPEDPIPIDQAA